MEQSNYELVRNITRIISLRIPVSEDSPVYQIFKQRKIMAEKYNKEGQEVQLEYIEQCNQYLLEYLGIW